MTKKKSLILVAHGSRRSQSNTEFEQLVKIITPKLSSKYDYIQHCFLEIAKPSLKDSIQKSLDLDILDITVFPYFLNNGKHISQDIPKIVSSFRKSYPECSITVTDYVGKLPNIPNLIIDKLK